ncbi:allergen Asp f 7 homolog [Piliocolobus tephrosceles]|uniref:allergen Asp f 7 homolog n=1 Tax=Piliocolobus tephrosceles TaxID=591936 RepID=UPI0013019B07|nr:allergen Asp f 7 homolog [Piliocolobus tephrosceles]
MHFLFPIPSVETVFPVSDLHCPFQATPSWARTRRRPRPRPIRAERSAAASRRKGEPGGGTAGGGEESSSRRRRLGVGGEAGSSMFARGSAGTAGRSRRVPGGFPYHRCELLAGSWPAGCRHQMLTRPPRPGSLETRQLAGLAARRRGSFRWPLPPPAAPPASPVLPPPPESITTAGPQCPRLSGTRPPPPPSLRAETKPSRRLPPLSSVGSQESRGPRLAR